MNLPIMNMFIQISINNLVCKVQERLNILITGWTLKDDDGHRHYEMITGELLMTSLQEASMSLAVWETECVPVPAT